MPTQALTQHTFDRVVSGGQIVLVDFWASWCGWCTKFAPIYQESSNLHPDIVYATVDTEAEPALTAAAQVSSLPTLQAYREGLLVYSNPGFQTSAQLEDVVQQIMWMDMDAVRRELAERMPGYAEAVSAQRSAAATPTAGPAGGPARYGWPGLRAY
ncbi:thioredoxin family protein [Nocardia transvalensis]|uniref:thioredoxin family protein n=1 Tax=Nocardia transvalensis TaxID=37333 RepID=UPI001894F31C|nr:thioredoxin domain-containing protein [Nocardia transvalensis]MBF6331583.1 thiol reductase thioredoxin [Nocardia transvalensis]